MTHNVKDGNIRKNISLSGVLPFQAHAIGGGKIMRLMTSVQMKSCSVCGVESVFNARFCAQCGVAFESPETATPD
ncbi:MAG: hypothetical protein NTY46_13080, partial [Candidatus Sumerlaeota bacterium]|nr:hypothetical protein [Candidatus Sumerlaeota bacterium]